MCLHLNVQSEEVVLQLLGFVDVRFVAAGTHHVPDVFVSHCDGEVLLETSATDGALARGERLHLRETAEEQVTFRQVDIILNHINYFRSLSFNANTS